MVLCRGQGAAFIGRGELGAEDGTGVARHGRGRHGRGAAVHGRRRVGRGRQGRGARGPRGGWRTQWRSGRGRARVGRPGWLQCVHARWVFDRGSAGMAPANAGREELGITRV